ncbi:fibronectin type III domain-containing protein 11 [Apteryx mantelli]|uniref:Fibronectin type III domain-containing protein 11 n=1 Tax=Apteryx mantelli TaxID=2696672 RepID=A0A8B7JFF6_9AVES
MVLGSSGSLPPPRATVSFGIMDMYLNEFETSLESTECNQEGHNDATWKMYLERRSIVLAFLRTNLSLHLLKCHQKRIELLKKSSFYIEILPKHLALGGQNHLMLPTAMFQLIDPWRFQRMKKVGTTQTKIQFLLLTDLLEQLERGREELVYYLETCDVVTFLSRWDLIKQRLSNLSELMDSFLDMLVPGKLYVKHHLVPDVRATKVPHIGLVLSTKMPVVFDRKESVAHEDWATLKWFSTSQQSQHEQYELCFRLLEHGMQKEKGHCGILTVTSNTCKIQNLLCDRAYKFTIRRAETYSLVYEQWHDSITLKTETNPDQDMDSSLCEPEG